MSDTENEFTLVSTPIPKPDMSAFEYPFSLIDVSHNSGISWKEYHIKDFCEGLLSEEKCDCGNFPNNITEFYWIHKGENDRYDDTDGSWIILCKLDNNNFAYYIASCGYTGF